MKYVPYALLFVGLLFGVWDEQVHSYRPWFPQWTWTSFDWLIPHSVFYPTGKLWGYRIMCHPLETCVPAIIVSSALAWILFRLFIQKKAM